MADIARRFKDNPLLKPEDLAPSVDGLKIECLLNPGAFTYDGKTFLLLRVAERPEQKKGRISLPIMEDGAIRILEFDRNDSDLEADDPRKIRYKGRFYLTTLSHLRLVHSKDGRDFRPTNGRPLIGSGPLEAYGIEDCRVTRIDSSYYLTYTAVSGDGIGVGMMSTSDWSEFSERRMIISGPNKDCAIFGEKIDGFYYCLHRPSMAPVGGNYIWIAKSPDLEHWGDHRCIVRTRRGMWDSERVGAGAAPIKTPRGWLEIYHAADDNSRYCLGALLLDLKDPTKVIARSKEPIMEPIMEYEQTGFFNNVVFTNGHVVCGDTITVYCGAGDRVICGAELSMAEIFDMLNL